MVVDNTRNGNTYTVDIKWNLYLQLLCIKGQKYRGLNIFITNYSIHFMYRGWEWSKLYLLTVCNKNWLSLVPLIGNVTVRYCVRKYVKGTQAIQERQKAHCACKKKYFILQFERNRSGTFHYKISSYATCNLTYHFAYFLLYSFHIFRPYFGQISLKTIVRSVRFLVLVIDLEVPLLQHLLRIDICYNERDLTHLALDKPLLDLSQHGVQEGRDLLVRGREDEESEMLGGLERLRRIYPPLIEYTVNPIDCNEEW